jgi:hypothetical protein
VPIVGGHLTLGAPAALSAFCTGTVTTPLRAAAARPGDVLLAAFCLEGSDRGHDPPIWSSLREREPAQLREDGEALVEVAERGLCHARATCPCRASPARCCSCSSWRAAARRSTSTACRDPTGMAHRALGPGLPELRLRPRGAARAGRGRLRGLRARGLACAPCGAFDDSRVLRLAGGGESAEVWDLAAEGLTRRR